MQEDAYIKSCDFWWAHNENNYYIFEETIKKIEFNFGNCTSPLQQNCDFHKQREASPYKTGWWKVRMFFIIIVGEQGSTPTACQEMVCFLELLSLNELDFWSGIIRADPVASPPPPPALQLLKNPPDTNFLFHYLWVRDAHRPDQSYPTPPKQISLIDAGDIWFLLPGLGISPPLTCALWVPSRRLDEIRPQKL